MRRTVLRLFSRHFGLPFTFLCLHPHVALYRQCAFLYLFLWGTHHGHYIGLLCFVQFLVLNAQNPPSLFYSFGCFLPCLAFYRKSTLSRHFIGPKVYRMPLKAPNPTMKGGLYNLYIIYIYMYIPVPWMVWAELGPVTWGTQIHSSGSQAVHVTLHSKTGTNQGNLYFSRFRLQGVCVYIYTYV